MALLKKLIIAAMGLMAATPALTASSPSEYQVKAVFLFNFSQFVDWPPQAFSNPQAPLIIGVLGSDPFGTELDDVVRGETVNGRPLVVQRYRTVSEIGQCHILFIATSESDRLRNILKALERNATLTVSDMQDAARRGVMVRFVTDRNRVRLRINQEAAKAAGLTISSKLLRPAQIVTTEGD